MTATTKISGECDRSRARRRVPGGVPLGRSRIPSSRVRADFARADFARARFARARFARARFAIVLVGLAAVGLVRDVAASVTFGGDGLPPFFAEVESGASVTSFDAYGDVGIAVRAAVGVGVPLDGVPFELYVTASFTWAHLADTRRSAYHTTDLVNDSYVYAFGLRATGRPYEDLEVLLDVQGGYRRAGASAVVDGTETYSMTEGHALPIVGVAARYRFLGWLFVGLRWECQFLQAIDGPDVPATAAGYATPRGERWQMNILLSAAAQF